MVDPRQNRTIKRCRRCGVTQPITEFAKNGVNRRSGQQMYHSWCKPCWYVYKQELKDRGPRNAKRLAPTHCRDCQIALTPANKVANGKSLYTGKDLWQNRCKQCWLIYQQKHRNARSADPSAAKARMLKFSFGMTLEEYEVMERAQNHKCAICGLPEDAPYHKTGKTKRLSVDHDHNTGAIRGLLCNRCNRALGLLRDDPKVLQAMIEYLAA